MFNDHWALDMLHSTFDSSHSVARSGCCWRESLGARHTLEPHVRVLTRMSRLPGPPGWEAVPRRVVGEVDESGAISVYHVDLPAGVQVAREGDLRAIGRPLGPNRVARETAEIRPVGIDHRESAARESDLRPVGRPPRLRPVRIPS